MTSDEEIRDMLTDTITPNPVATAARQWIAEHEVDSHEADSLEEAEDVAYAMDAANVRAYLDLCYEGGAEAFVGDQA